MAWDKEEKVNFYQRVFIIRRKGELIFVCHFSFCLYCDCYLLLLLLVSGTRKALLDPSKKKTFNDLCASFTDACNEVVNLEDSSDDLVNELIYILRNATLSNQNLNESNIAAIKVTNLLIPAVNFISGKTIAKSSNAQDAKISKICSGLRINSYEIDKQNQNSCRENLRIIGLTENEEENCFDILKFEKPMYGCEYYS